MSKKFDDESALGCCVILGCGVIGFFLGSVTAAVVILLLKYFLN